MQKITLKLSGIFVFLFVATFVSLNLFGNKTTNVLASNDTPSVEILKYNVSYSDSIYIAYAVYGEGFQYNKVEVELLFWNTHQDTYLKGTEDIVGTQKGKTKVDGKQCLVFYSEGLAAKHMTDDLFARAYVVVDGKVDTNKEGIYIITYTLNNDTYQMELKRIVSVGGVSDGE